MLDTDHTRIDEVIGLLKPEHFYAESHRWIFEACLALHAVGQPIDFVQVGAWLKSRERIAQIGGPSYLVEMVNSVPAVGNVRAYAQTVVDKAKARAVILECQRIAADGYGDYGGVHEYAADAAERLHVVAHEDMVKTTEHVSDVMKSVAKTMIAVASSGRRMSGSPTGFDRYDRLTAGLHPGDLTIVAARPGMGKTAWVLRVAVRVAAGTPDENIEPAGVLVASLEMPREQVGSRMACSEGKVDVGKVRAGGLNPSDFDRIIGASKRIGASPLWIDDQAGISVLQLRARARRIQSELARKPVLGLNGEVRTDKGGSPLRHRLGLVVVDYLQLMSGAGDSREQVISGISRDLKGLAKELCIPVIAISQLNRSCESRDDKRPQLSDLRESGAIEQDADNIVFIFRDDYYTKGNSQEPNLAELIVAKQRNGPTGVAKVRFDKEYTRFDNLPDSEFYE